MKSHVAIALIAAMINTSSFAQNNVSSYPEPEFMQEIYAFNRNANSLVRLEKEASRLETKTKMAGWSGSESAYNFHGERAPVRFSSGQLSSFVFRTHQDYSNGKKDSSNAASSSMNSVANMMDDVMDPSKSIALYVLDAKNGTRELILQSSGGVFSKKNKHSDKVSLSFRKIKDGYYEIVLDKPLPSGEYAFMNAMGGVSEGTMYLFGVD